MQIRNLNDLFLHTLQVTHSAEKAIAEALPQFAKTVRSAGPDVPLDGYIAQTEQRIRRLEQLFKLVHQSPSPTRCPTIEHILAEANELSGSIEDRDARKAAIFAAIKTIKHVLLERYGTLAAWARDLRMSDPVQLLLATLDEGCEAHPQTSGVGEWRPEREQVRDISMGERLTALFDRKK